MRTAELEDQVAGGTPRAGKAMTRTIGDLEKMQPPPSERDFFRASKKKSDSTRKISSTSDSLRSGSRQGARPASRRSARASLRVPRFGFCPSRGERALPRRLNQRRLVNGDENSR